MTAAQHVRFRLAISADDYLAYYQGAARDVIVRAEDGRRIRFPAGALQRFLTHAGIHGRFELRFDADHKLIGVQRLEE
jgi:hypothetical protein